MPCILGSVNRDRRRGLNPLDLKILFDISVNNNCSFFRELPNKNSSQCPVTSLLSLNVNLGKLNFVRWLNRSNCVICDLIKWKQVIIETFELKNTRDKKRNYVWQYLCSNYVKSLVHGNHMPCCQNHSHKKLEIQKG